MNTIGGMAVSIVGDNSKFDKAVDDSEKKFINFGKSLQKTGKSLTKYVTGPLLGVATAMIAATIEAGNYADKILDLSEITGLSTDTLQELEQVATVAGVSFEGLTGTIQRFSSRLPTIEAGASESAKAFESLGVDLRDASGEIRDMEVLFPELIVSLQNIENVTERNATAQQIFGRSLGDLAPVLGLTADEFKNARDQAHALGLVQSGDALKAANDYRIGIDTLKREIQGMWRTLAQDLIPLIQDSVLPAFRRLLEGVRDVAEWFGNLTDGQKGTLVMVAAALAATGPLLMGVGTAIKLFGLLKIAILGVNAALLANPFILATAAVVGIGVAIAAVAKKARDSQLGKIAEEFGDIESAAGLATKEIEAIEQALVIGAMDGFVAA